jgi:hypothetical protein
MAGQDGAVDAREGTFAVAVRYAVLADGSVRLDSFAAPGGGA